MASASVTALGTQAVTSFLLQVLAAATIGAAGYGRYAIILGLLSTLTALQSGLRDSAIVLERNNPVLQGAMLTSQYAAGAAGALIALAVGVESDLTTFSGAWLLGLMVGLWSLEEMGRRFLIRDQRFGALVINDLTYTAGAFGTAGVLYAVHDALHLSSFLWAMSAGSAISFGLSIAQLPAGTYNLERVPARGFRAVLAFAGWRSAQVAVRPATITLTRIVIAAVASAAVLGQLETARLVVQPVWVLISGLGPFLLSHFARRRDTGREGLLPAKLASMAVAFAATVAAWSAAMVLAADVVQPILVGEDYPVDRLAISAWGCFYVCAAIGFPLATILVARQAALQVFLARSLDGVIGLGAVVALALGPGARWTPFGLAIGATIGAGMLWRMARSLTGTLENQEDGANGVVTPAVR